MVDLNFQYPTVLVTKDSAIFAPPEYPPPDTWALSVDAKGNPLSYFGDDLWDFRALEKKAILNFSNAMLSKESVALLKFRIAFFSKFQ